MAEKWGDGVTPLGSPKKRSSAVWSVSGGPRLHQVQEECYGCPREPSLFTKPHESHPDSLASVASTCGAGLHKQQSSTNHLAKLLDK